MEIGRLLCCSAVDDDTNRARAADLGIEYEFPPEPPPPGFSVSECRFCQGSLWISDASRAKYAEVVMGGTEAFIVCTLCVQAAEEGKLLG